jgi:hypothetical protein
MDMGRKVWHVTVRVPLRLVVAVLVTIAVILCRMCGDSPPANIPDGRYWKRLNEIDLKTWQEAMKANKPKDRRE